MSRDKGIRTPRIVLFGLFGSGNFGNDGSLETVLSSLRRKVPGADLLCVCYDAEGIRQRYSINTTRIRIASRAPKLLRFLDKLFLTLPGRAVDLVHAILTLHGVDMMIIPGTGILDDFSERPHQMPLNIFLWCLSARIVGTRIAYVSVGAGPINNRLSRFLMLTAARMAHYRSFRDGLSRGYLARFGIDTRHDPIMPDVVFNLPTPSISKPQEATVTVGLGVMDYHGWSGHREKTYRTYIDKLADFAVYLISTGNRIRILTGQNTDEQAALDVVRIIGERAGEQAARQLIWVPGSSLHDLMNEIALTDLVVATRYHNIVCALKMGRPAISLEYSGKNTAVMKAVGLEEFCGNVETFAIANLIQQFQRLKRERIVHEAGIRARIVEFQRALDDQDAALLALLQEKLNEGAMQEGQAASESVKGPVP